MPSIRFTPKSRRATKAVLDELARSTDRNLREARGKALDAGRERGEKISMKIKKTGRLARSWKTQNGQFNQSGFVANDAPYSSGMVNAKHKIRKKIIAQMRRTLKKLVPQAVYKAETKAARRG